MVGYGEAESDGKQDEKEAKPWDELFGFREAGKRDEQQGETDIEPPLHGQRPRFPIEVPKRGEEVLSEGGETPDGEGFRVARNDLETHQKIVDQQDKEIVGQDAQCGSGVKSQDFLATQAIVMPLQIGNERFPDEETAHNEEDVDAMRHGKVGETVEGSVVK